MGQSRLPRFQVEQRVCARFFPFQFDHSSSRFSKPRGFFACVKEHLTNEGRFVIDVFNPRLDILIRDPTKRYPVAEYPDPDGRGMVTITENNVYDAASQVNRIKWYYDINEGNGEFVVENNMRMLFPQELDALLHYNGFVIEAKYGNYGEMPFESTSPKQLIVCYRYGSQGNST